MKYYPAHFTKTTQTTTNEILTADDGQMYIGDGRYLGRWLPPWAPDATLLAVSCVDVRKIG